MRPAALVEMTENGDFSIHFHLSSRLEVQSTGMERSEK